MANVEDIAKQVDRDRAQNPQGTEPAKVGEPSSYDQRVQRLRDINDQTLGGITNEQKAFQSAVGTANLSMHDKKLEKLQSYGARYNEYGFNPYLNNEKLYDDLTTTGEQWMRSFKGAGKLMNIGFTDNALFGAFADDDSHKEYGKAVDFYSSSKGGATGFMQNLVLNSGYTVGIIADMVLEEAALLGITALTGGTAGAETLPAMGAKFAHTGRLLSNFQNLRKAFSATSDLNRTIRAANQSRKGSNAFVKTANFLNPLENTTNFVKNLKSMDQLRDMNNLGKATHGTAALFRDVKATHLAWTEADLESSMLGDELYQHLVAEHEGPLSKGDVKHYRDLAKKGAKYAHWENMVAIGATNKLVFNNMFKAFDDLKGLGQTIGESPFYKMLKTGKAPTQIIEKGTFKGFKQTTKMIFSDGFGKGMGRIAKTIGSKGGTYFTANIGEGLQENLQEMIHAKNMSQFGNAHHGNYFNSLLHGLEEQFTMQGGSTFLSGFLMGGLISPVNMAVKAGGNFSKGGYEYFTDGKSYEQTKTSEKNRLEADAKKIDELFEHASDVFKAKGNNLAVQSAMEREMAEARKNDDEFEFKNAQNKSYRAHLQTALKYNMMDQFKEHLESFKSMTVDEFYEAFPTVNKGLNKSQRDAVIDNKIARADAFVEQHNWVNANVQNPINLKQVSAEDPNYRTIRAYHDYFEQAKEELIFAKHEFLDNMNRREKLLGEAMGFAQDSLFGPSMTRAEAGSENVSFQDYQVLFSPASINGELKALENEMAASDPELESADEKALMKTKKARYDNLKRYKESLDEMQEVGALLEEHDLMDEDLMTAQDRKERKRLENWYSQASTRVFNRHNDYLKEVSPNLKGAAFENFSEKSFELLHDYYKLDTKNAELDNLINVMTNPTMLDQVIQRQVEMHDVHMAQFKRYVENSMAMDRDQDVMNNAMADLFKKGVGFPLKYVEWMVDKGKLPPVFYDLESGDVLLDTVTTSQGEMDPVALEIAMKGSEKLKQAKEILQAAYDKLIIKPSEDLKEPSAKEKEQAEKGEDEFVDTDKAGGATDRTYKRKGPSVSKEKLDVVDDATPLQEYPTEILSDLVEQYKADPKNQQLDTKIDELTPENFTPRFETWADNKAEAYVESLKANKEVIRDNFETLTNEQKVILRDEGYSVEDINTMDAMELRDLLQTTGKPQVEVDKTNEKESKDEDVEDLGETEEGQIEDGVEIEQEEEDSIIVADSVLDEGISENFEGAIFGEVGNYTDTANAQPRVDEIIAIGEALDAGTITAEMGPMRAQIDGRLVVNYITSDGRMFFMYKSIGEGTGAESQGEWVPIPGWSGTGWFIKTLHNGKNPKFTKYGSESFKRFDQDLKDTENLIFDDAQETAEQEVPTETEVETPDVVSEAEQLTDEDTTEDENKRWRKDRARDIFEELRSISTYTTPEGEAEFFKRVETQLIDFLGQKRFTHTITPEVIKDVLNEIKADLKITEDNLNWRMTARYANEAINKFNNPEKYDQVEKNKEKRLEMMEDLGYSAEEVSAFSKATVDRILREDISKAKYLEIQNGIKNTEVQEVVDILKKMDTNVRTESELSKIRGDFSLQHPELYSKYEGQLDLELRKIMVELANLKGFKNLKEGDIVEMADGTLRKVSKLQKSQVKLVNYNSIIADEITMKSTAFDKGTRRIVNDFNKYSKGLKSTLEKGNVDELSDLLRTFTGGAFVANETVPTEEDLKEHFKLCK